MAELGIEDLIPDDDEDDSTDPDPDAEPRGEWLGNLVTELKDDGMLLPLLYGEEYLPKSQKPAQQAQQTPNAENTDMDDDTIDTDSIDAEQIAEICRGIEQTAGDVTVTQIAAMAETQPERVNQMIEQHL